MLSLTNKNRFFYVYPYGNIELSNLIQQLKNLDQIQQYQKKKILFKINFTFIEENVILFLLFM